MSGFIHLPLCNRARLLITVLAPRPSHAGKEFSQAPLTPGLDPSKQLTQYIHDVWHTEKAPLEGAIRAIIQTRDGHLWIGDRRMFSTLLFHMSRKGRIWKS